VAGYYEKDLGCGATHVKGHPDHYMVTDPPLEQLYNEGQTMLLSGKHREALERFKRIYDLDSCFRDVAEIVEDYYSSKSEEVWLKKYQARFTAKPSGRLVKDSVRFYIIFIIVACLLGIVLFRILVFFHELSQTH
jgi:hypothetical protein